MVRTYKRKTVELSAKEEQAVDAMRNGSNVNGAAIAYGVSRTGLRKKTRQHFQVVVNVCLRSIVLIFA